MWEYARRIVWSLGLLAITPMVLGAAPPDGEDPDPAVPLTLVVPNTPPASNGTYTVSWTAGGLNFATTTFQFQRYFSGSAQWVPIAGGNKITKTFAETNLASGSYQYRFRGCRLGGCSDWLTSKSVQVTNPSSPLVIGAQFNGPFLYGNSEFGITANEYFNTIAPGSTLLNRLAGTLVGVEANLNHGDKGSFSRWLARQKARMPSAQWIGARYYNHRELGIGRGMYCAEDVDSGRYAACYVVNCGNPADRTNDQGDILNYQCTPSEERRASFDLSRLDVILQLQSEGIDKPLVGQINERLALLKEGLPAAVVAMEWDANDLVNPVRFYAFDYVRNYAVSRLQLDGVSALGGVSSDDYPGTCVTCHGGYISKEADGRVSIQGAHFLPFDVTNAVFENEAAAAAGKAAFQRFNYIIKRIEGWTGPIVDQIAALESGDGVPAGWTGRKNQPFYNKVVRPYCQSCHRARGSAFMEDPQYFFTQGVADRVCGQSHDMPRAEVTEAALYQDADARLMLRNRLNAAGIDCTL